MKDESSIREIGESISRQKEISFRINTLTENLGKADAGEKEMILTEIKSLKDSLLKMNKKGLNSVKKVSMYKPLPNSEIKEQAPPSQKTEKVPREQRRQYPHLVNSPQSLVKDPKELKKYFKLSKLEKETIKRMKKKQKEGFKEVKIEQRSRKPNKYVKLSSKFFYKTSMDLLKKGKFKKIKRELVKANLNFIPANYLSFMFFTTLLSVFAAFFIFIFFLFFSLTVFPPFIVSAEGSFVLRIFKVFWIVLVIPVVVFGFTYFYPSMEKKSLEGKINAELPFATIHMSSISSSLVEPSKIFSIMVQTKEYPNLSKEFTKLLNEINIYGYDFVTALKDISFNSPSKKLSELLSGLSTTITSGGNLPDFFEKRAQSLLFEYRLEREKQSKAAETFMDIYISVVIAAPMILMLLLMMMRVSGLGLSLSTGTITLVMIIGVTMLNLLFLTFLHLKSPEKV